MFCIGMLCIGICVGRPEVVWRYQGPRLVLCVEYGVVVSLCRKARSWMVVLEATPGVLYIVTCNVVLDL